MKNIFAFILDKLKTYLSDNTTESAMRLYGFLIIITSCLCTIGYTVFVCISIKNIDLANAAAVYAGLATFTGTGIAGKYFQKKIETGTDDQEKNNLK